VVDLHHLPPVMTLTLIPLALLALCGGFLELPENFASHGILGSFLAALPGFAPHAPASSATEFSLQIGAATISLIGFGLAWSRYTGQRRAESLKREEAGLPLADFLMNGWYLDQFYRVLFIRPYILLSRLLWKGIDEALIDGALNGLGRATQRAGCIPASWSTGRVATSLIALAGGTAAVLGYVVWWLP
jgi:NADH-quinone oxidoreductase subunit L